MLPKKEQLDEIQKNTNNVLTNQYFASEQWIQYNIHNKHFEYEDGVFLGKTSSEVIKTLEKISKTFFGKWIHTAVWRVKEKK